MTILQHFTGTPRRQQSEALTALEKDWERYDVFVLRLPVGAGKSRVAHAIASWQGEGTILTPTNALVS